jgi:hypothetical protein
LKTEGIWAMSQMFTKPIDVLKLNRS